MMAKMVEKGWLGRKTGKGFYLYPKDAKKGAKKQLNPEVLPLIKEFQVANNVDTSLAKKITVQDLQFRIISRFINEAAFCLQDEIIRAPADGTYLLDALFRKIFIVLSTNILSSQFTITTHPIELYHR